MATPHLPEDEFIRLFEELGPARVAELSGAAQRTVFARRASLERKLGRTINGPDKVNAYRFEADQHPEWVHLVLQDGVVIVGSDAHYLPNKATTAHRAMVHFVRTLRPVAVIENGDVIDAPTIGRHPPIGWEHRPSLVSEIFAAQERLEELMLATAKRPITPPALKEERIDYVDRAKFIQQKLVSQGVRTRFIWPIGNHDARFNTRLATQAPEYAKVKGVHLKDHFPTWEACWACHVNPQTTGWTEIKHRWKGGVHAPFNNAKESGVHFATGHDHSLAVAVFTNRRQTVFGIDTGTLADPNGPQFVNYTESNPKNWRSGFQVLTYHQGELMWPEPVWVMDEKLGLVCFRGQVIQV